MERVSAFGIGLDNRDGHCITSSAVVLASKECLDGRGVRSGCYGKRSYGRGAGGEHMWRAQDSHTTIEVHNEARHQLHARYRQNHH